MVAFPQTCQELRTKTVGQRKQMLETLILQRKRGHNRVRRSMPRMGHTLHTRVRLHLRDGDVCGNPNDHHSHSVTSLQWFLPRKQTPCHHTSLKPFSTWRVDVSEGGRWLGRAHTTVSASMLRHATVRFRCEVGRMPSGTEMNPLSLGQCSCTLVRRRDDPCTTKTLVASLTVAMTMTNDHLYSKLHVNEALTCPKGQSVWAVPPPWLAKKKKTIDARQIKQCVPLRSLAA